MFNKTEKIEQMPENVSNQKPAKNNTQKQGSMIENKPEKQTNC